MARGLNHAACGLWLASAIVSPLNVAMAADRGDISDERLMQGVQEELNEARGVAGDEIDVSVVSGVVTLTGSVDSVLTERRAMRIAEMTRGAMTVVDRLEVRESGRSDQSIEQDVREALAADATTERYEVEARVNEGTLTLTGAVESWGERELAELVASGVRGVRAVNNRIEVRAGEPRSDFDIEQDVAELLRWDPQITARRVGVQARDGEVVLTGSVGSAYERRRVERYARMAGAQSVDASGLETVWWLREGGQPPREQGDSTTGKGDGTQGGAERVSDDAIAKAIGRALVLEPRVYAEHMDVKVSGGKVTLTGTVDHLVARQTAERIAARTRGVRDVSSNLRVEMQDVDNDTDIASQVESALRRDPWIDRQEIRVDADDGRVRLLGEVGSYFERARAGALAARTRGVRDVENLLVVDYESPAWHTYHGWDPALHDFDFDRDGAMTDAEIRDEVRDELFWSPFVDSEDILVSVEGGVVTLSGTVDDWDDLNDATENAFEGGATRVENRLKVVDD